MTDARHHLEESEIEDVRASLYRNYGRDFQGAGECFDRAGAERWARAYDWYLRGWLPDCKDARIADLGCGSGALLHFFGRRGYHNLTGVDISPDQIARARQVVSSVECANVLEWLVQKEHRFDLLVALDVIEHLTRNEAVRFLELARRALRPEGRLVLQTANADAPLGMGVRYGDPTHEWCYNASQLENLLRRAGFANVDIREQGPVPWGYSTASTLRWLLWKLLCTGVQLWWISETGARARVLSRSFLICAK